MRRKFDSELKKNLKYGIIAIGFVLLFMAGFYFHAVQEEMEVNCSFCTSSFCMDNDLLCGDFGIYYFKFGALIFLGWFGGLCIFSQKLK